MKNSIIRRTNKHKILYLLLLSLSFLSIILLVDIPKSNAETLPIPGTFSGQYHGEFISPTTFTRVILDGSVSGNLISHDNGSTFTPTGNWSMFGEGTSYDGNGFPIYHHKYNGPASSDCSGNDGPCITISDSPHNIKALEYDNETHTFTHQVCGVDREDSTTLLQFCIPTTTGPNPLSGSSANAEVATCWDFSPDFNSDTGSLQSSSNSMYSDAPSSITYYDKPISSSDVSAQANTDMCKQNIKVKGKIFVETPKTDRGNIPIRNLQVELCSQVQCVARTTTDSAGNYVLSSDQISDTKNLNVVITFLDSQNHMRASQYDRINYAKTDPAEIRFSDLIFKEDPITKEPIANADIKFSVKSPWIYINNGAPGPSLQVSNIDKNKLSSLAAIYYYADRALDFSNKNLNIAQTYNTPLNVKVFFNTGAASNFDSNHFPLFLYLDNDDSNGIMSTNPKKVEPAQDNTFHEIGHYLIYELYRGAFPVDPALHPEYVTAAATDPDKDATKRNCHHGYAQLDSSCAMNEAKASFLGVMLADKVLDDPAHAYYKNRAHIYNYDNSGKSTGVDLEKIKSIAGIHDYKNTKNIKHYNLAEEFALASLLWDLYDNTPAETLPYGLGNDMVFMNLNDLTNSLLPADTTNHFYTNLVNVNVVDKNKLDAIFAAFDVCKDTNGDGKCKITEVNDGLSSWKVNYNKHVYEYPYPGYKYPNGRP